MIKISPMIDRLGASASSCALNLLAVKGMSKSLCFDLRLFSCFFCQTRWFDSASWITETQMDTPGLTLCAYLLTNAQHHLHLQQWIAVLGGSGSTCVWECKAWLAVLHYRRDQTERTVFVPVWERFFFFMTVPPSRLFSHLHVSSSSLIFFYSRPHFKPSSCVAPAHAWSQHQSTLLRDFWVFSHALPQPLFLPEWVHPVYLVPVTFAWRGEETSV